MNVCAAARRRWRSSKALASIELPLGLLMFITGSVYGAVHWAESARTGAETPAGMVMLAAQPILMGMQLVLAFLSNDIASVPKRPLHKEIALHRLP